MKYIAVSGDTWDSIAYKVYGEEFLMDYLIQENPLLGDTVMFAGNEELECPDRIEIQEISVNAPWDNDQTNNVTLDVVSAPWG